MLVVVGHLPCFSMFLLPSYIHNVYIHTYPFIMYLALILLNFHYDVGHQSLEIFQLIKFHLPECFSLSVTYTYIWPSVLCFFLRNILFT